MTQGSRAVGIDLSCSWSTTAPFSTLRVSSSDGSPLTVTVASTLEILSAAVVLVFCPTETCTSGLVTFVKPCRS